MSMGNNSTPEPAPGPPPAWGQPTQGGQPPQWGQGPQWGQPAPGWQQPAWGGPGLPQPGPQQYLAPPKPGVIPLRPLGLGEILDGAFQTARRNGRAMFGSALLVQAISTVLTILVLALIGGASLFALFADGTSGNQVPESVAASLIVTLLGAGGVSVIVSVIGTMVMQGVLVIPVMRATVNRQTGFRQMWRLAKPRVWTLVLLALLYSVVAILMITLLGLTAVVLFLSISFISIPISFLILLGFAAVAVWVGTKLILAPAAIVVEGHSVFSAIGRSWDLTGGNFWRTFGTYFLAQLIVGAISAVISVPVGLVIGLLSQVLNPNPKPSEAIAIAIITQLISYLVSALIGAVALAFQTGVLALLYVDLRMRKEGFDLALLKDLESTDAAAQDGIPGAPVNAAAPPPASWPGT